MERVRRMLLLTVSISVLSVLAVMALTFDEGTILALERIDPWFFLLALCAHLLGYVFGAVRMRSLTHGMGYTVSLRRCMSIVFHNLFLAAITPSMMGGEPIRIHMLKESGVPYGKAGVVVFGERILDGLFFIVAIPMVIVLYHYLGRSTFMLMLATSAVLLIGLVALIAYALRKPYRVGRLGRMALISIVGVSLKLVGKLMRKPPTSSRIVEIVDAEIRAFRDGLRELLGQGRGSVPMAFASTLGYWIAQYSVVVWVLLGLVGNVDLVEVVPRAFAAQIVLSMLMILPLTPGASGIAEAGALALFGSFTPSSVLGVLVIGWRAVHYYFDVVFGGLYNLMSLRRLSET
ncbi:MAG TPA: flippase-like domain-containing protein [Methermicoccus shengliensis]|uniref:Flippase-like domain-containing protein n=1 Tax=Methermicoccus shengliensis TaxID=660064 RepID=A0A832RXG7_9EURY|nr:MAG: hypothetical protein XD46_0308 [Euryarchaeota archaeon 55_53]HIH69998.1 flippase-like domain-containing protein [Methermicoccus shengliensis]